MFHGARVAGIGAILLALLLTAPGHATQQNRDQDQSDERDGPSRNEVGRLSHIPLVTLDGETRITRLVIIQTRLTWLVETSGTADGFGVEFENHNKLDLSDVPLLGSVFGRAYSADDFTDENRIGTVYDAGDSTLATVLNEMDSGLDIKVTVVNGDGAYKLLMQPKIIETTPTDLGAFGHLPSVRNALTQVELPDEATVVLGGLTENSVPDAANKVPWLGDIPMLQQLFRGTAHRGEQNELVLFIKPSILTRSED